MTREARSTVRIDSKVRLPRRSRRSEVTVTNPDQEAP